MTGQVNEYTLCNLHQGNGGSMYARGTPKNMASPATDRKDHAPRVGCESPGCPQALVGSERILTQLRTEGYQDTPDF